MASGPVGPRSCAVRESSRRTTAAVCPNRRRSEAMRAVTKGAAIEVPVTKCRPLGLGMAMSTLMSKIRAYDLESDG